MNTTEVKKQLQKIKFFDGFEFNKPEETTLFATIKTTSITYKTHDKTTIVTGNMYNLFVAHMYKGEKREFFYLILYRNDKLKYFKCRTWHELEGNKLYASGNTVKKLIKNVKGYIEKGYEL